MANEVLAEQPNRKGTYQLSETVNGKPSWKSATQAIWYNPEYKDWFIGDHSDIGTNVAGIYSVASTEYDCPQRVPEDKWKYWDAWQENWQDSSSKDVIIQCTGMTKQDNTTTNSIFRGQEQR